MPSLSRRKLSLVSPRCDPREPCKLLLIGGAQLSMYWRQCRLFARELLIEIRGVGGSLDSREVGRWDLFVVYIVEIDVFEEEVSLDILCIGFTSSQSPRGVSSEELEISIKTCACEDRRTR